MAKAKVTFTLDEATVSRLRLAARRLDKPQSQVVREAIQDYSERIGRLSESERLRLLEIFDRLVPKIPARAVSEVDREIHSLRRARRAGGRRSSRRAR